MRPVMGRGIARPMLAQTGGVMKRNYHEKVIDHYENPRNVRDDGSEGVTGYSADYVRLET